MADDVMEKAAADAPATPTSTASAGVTRRPESRAERARRLAYRGRFAFFYILLAVVAGAGVGALVVLVQRGEPAEPPAWSAWQPEGSAERRAAQIADHVSGPYRLPSGRPLVAIIHAGQPIVTGPDGAIFQVRALAVEPDTTAGRAEATDIDTFDARRTLMYTMCGLGEGCTIAEGEASIARGQLLRRQALELALYSFEYIDDVDSVIVGIPPPAAGQTGTAVFLERDEVRPLLSRPLAETFPSATPPEMGAIPEAEERIIDRITRPRLYSYTYLQAQDGSPVMVLTPALGG